MEGDGWTQEDANTLSSPCNPNGSGELIIYPLNKYLIQANETLSIAYQCMSKNMSIIIYHN